MADNRAGPWPGQAPRGPSTIIVENGRIVEVRGGIDVSNGLQISQLPVSALGANSASVLRFNLRPSSPLKIVEDDELG